ncbi:MULTISPECIES: hypothetical protein [Halobacterium]|uniref:DUF7269 family protein n=1 Tax=Halobacterium TaxID=2239 RepID=UPI00073F4AB5|nr:MULTISPECIES: hypothetical protein [Halobacterium]MCG1003523.1 hypothetical protein [Halobacterium noricense]
MTSLRETLFAAVGVVCVAVAVGVLAGLAPASLVGAAGGVDATLATALVGAALVGYALRRRRQTEPTAETALADADDDESVSDPGQPVDGALDRIADGGDAFAGDARPRIRDRVHETAVRACAQTRGVSRDEAAAVVARGEWTDDPVAAAFLGDERAPRYPLGERLRGWVHADRAFRRRVERAVDAVHSLATEGSR